MVHDEVTQPDREEPNQARPGAARTVLALAIAWCRDEPWRIGEILPVPAEPPGTTVHFGRGPSLPGRPPKGHFGQLRPGGWGPSAPFSTPALSRYQLAIEVLDPGRATERLRLRNEGQCPMLRDEVAVATTELAPGQLAQLGNQLLLLCVRRAIRSDVRGEGPWQFPFGDADPHGMVGESGAIWELRRQIDLVAPRPGHVLIWGPSGSGKELVAQALHVRSPSSGRPMISRNAATLPEALIDAELFGNAKNYPNPGMRDRPGLIGEADGSTLFLDEIAELPLSAQAHLLRVLDAGEYQRLGESTLRRANLRVVAATNRGPEALKHDLLARFSFQITVPDLASRLEDIPLLLRHLSREAAASGAPVGGPSQASSATPHAQPPLWLVRQLLQQRYPNNVRQLRLSLWQLLLQTQPPSEDPSQDSAASHADPDGESEPGPPSPALIQRTLDLHDGSIEQSWRALGLSSRFALRRLIQRHGIEVRRRPGRRPKS